MRSLVICLLAICAGANVFAAAPTYSNEFLELPRGAKAYSLADASIVMPDQAFSVGGNPALLMTLDSKHAIGLMHVSHFEGLASSDLAAYATRLDSTSVMGVSLFRFGVDQIPNTTDLIDPSGNFDYDRLTYFSTADYAIHFSYARKRDSHSSWGVNLKLIYRKVGSFASAFGLGWDAGCYVKEDRFSYALQLTDVTSTVTTWSYNADALSIPDFVLPSGDTIRNLVPDAKVEVKLPVFRAAMAFPFQLNKDFGVTALAALKINTDGQQNRLLHAGRFSLDPSLAAELAYQSMVYLRIGCSQFQKITKMNSGSYWSIEPSLGLGLKLSDFQIDYALGNVSSMGLSRFSHIFSLKYTWGK